MGNFHGIINCIAVSPLFYALYPYPQVLQKIEKYKKHFICLSNSINAISRKK